MSQPPFAADKGVTMESMFASSARRTLLSIVGGAIGMLLLGLLLDRGGLALRGPWPTSNAWTSDGAATAALRALRVGLVLGSVALLIWIGLLCALSNSKNASAHRFVQRLPFGRLVARSLAVSMAASSLVPLAADASTRSFLPKRAATVAPSSKSAPGESISIDYLAASEKVEIERTLSPTTTAVDAPPPTVSIEPEPSRAELTYPTRIVTQGESFWAVAEKHVLANKAEATEHDINVYCHLLIDANRGAIPDPNNPDLIWIGTTIVMPPLSS